MKSKILILNGIIAGIIDEIGIVEIINEQLGIKPQEKLNSGILVKSIILNALGFVSRPRAFVSPSWCATQCALSARGTQCALSARGGG